MIQTLKIALLILGSVILQIALVSRMTMLGSRPDLPLALVVSIALFKGPFQGQVVGFSSGLVYDLLSGSPLLGVQSFSRFVIGYATGFIRGRLYSDNFITQLLSGFIATFAHKFITSAHLSLLFADTQFANIRFSGVILAAIVNSVLVVAVFWILRRVFRTEN